MKIRTLTLVIPASAHCIPIVARYPYLSALTRDTESLPKDAWYLAVFDLRGSDTFNPPIPEIGIEKLMADLESIYHDEVFVWGDYKVKWDENYKVWDVWRWSKQKTEYVGAGADFKNLYEALDWLYNTTKLEVKQ